MAVSTISTSFIEEFESGVHMAYQRMGSKLRNTIRTRNGVKNKTTFQKVGKGSATTKARHGNVAPMNLSHTNVNVTLEDYFAGEWIDDLDQLRVNHDEMMVAQQSQPLPLICQQEARLRLLRVLIQMLLKETLLFMLQPQDHISKQVAHPVMLWVLG